MKTILVLAVCLRLIVHVHSQTTAWTSWAECTEFLGCFQRTLNCDVGEGIDCLNEAVGAFEQIAVNCDTSPECLENVDEMFHVSEVSTS